jgi:hypothetical protein
MLTEFNPSTHINDSAILSRFREWIEVMRRADAAITAGEYDIHALAIEEADGLETEVLELPASGVVGLAIKTYLLVRARRGPDLFDPTASPGEITPNDGYEPDGRLRRDLRDLKGVAADLVRFLPELAPLCAGLLNAPLMAPTVTAEQAEIRRRAETLAAEHDGPFRPDDAGLIEAERRLWAIQARRAILYRKFRITPEIEAEILQPTIVRVEEAIRRFIAETTPRGLDGVMVRRRVLPAPDQQGQKDSLQF